MSRASVTRRKETHRHKGCGWLASRRGSKYTKKQIVEKDVVGLLLGEVEIQRKTHILAKDVVGLTVGDNEDLLIISQN